jgi:hypothetical protein
MKEEWYFRLAPVASQIVKALLHALCWPSADTLELLNRVFGPCRRLDGSEGAKSGNCRSCVSFRYKISFDRICRDIDPNSMDHHDCWYQL